MSGTNPFSSQLRTELERDAKQLDAACRHYFGVGIRMFRTAKFLFYMSTLAFSGYLIEVAGVHSLLVMAFAALLITGPEGVEAFLVRQDVIADPDED